MPAERYGIVWPDVFNPLMMELACWNHLIAGAANNKLKSNSPGAYKHYLNIHKTLWPKADWHEWKERRIRAFCDYKVNSWTGCGASGKTFDAGELAIVYWLADPKNTSVILTSTTGKMVRKRIWPVIQKLYHAHPGLPGNLVDSKTTLQSEKGDDKHGIFAIAVREGSTSKAVADIQGLHAKRMLLVIDEATDTPEAVFEAITNLRKGCWDFRIIVIGNPYLHLDPHGMICEPKDGWGSVDVEMEDWETMGIPKWEIDPGVCLHFDGLKSPNIRHGSNKWPYLITAQDVERARKAEHGEDNIGFWKFTRGFWAPEGVSNRIITEQMVEKYGGKLRYNFLSWQRKIAGLDPAFGGDRCVLRIAQIGDIEGDRVGVQLLKAHEIPINARSKEPVQDQIAAKAKEICEQEGVAPEDLGVDASGEAGVWGALVRVWSDQVIRVEFGGAPSERPVSSDDPRPCNEVYDRKVTELWFNIRTLLLDGQMRGFNSEDVKEFYSRAYEERGRKKRLVDKAECKKVLGRSPDHADAVSIVGEVARQRGLIVKGADKKTGSQDQKWLAKAREMSEVYSNEYGNTPTELSDSFHYEPAFDS